ncbi:MAG TPA: hypothetical protein VJS92_18330 [Candidatus Polarisedimenticolaceae bacterium]|nr:hypothetical protein [Candidatus Polarisedimenticolaceae bacterium]
MSAVLACVAPVSFSQLVERSWLVGEFVVESSVSRWTDDHHTIYTRVTFKPVDLIKGKLELPQLKLEFEGGTVDGEGIVSSVGVSFTEGETVILFVDEAPGVCPLVGCYQGKFTVQRDPVTGMETVVHGGFGHQGRAPGSPQPRPDPPSVSKDEFKANIRALLRPSE